MSKLTWGAAAFLPALALVASLSSASAADLSMPAPGPIMQSAAPIVNWTGFYAGVNAGYGWAFADHLAGPNSGSGINDFHLNGLFAGGQAGYNWQLQNNVVVGLEGDLQWSGIKGSCAAGVCGVPQATTHSINWFGTVRGRVGWAMGTWMPYLTGGVAFANATRTTTSGGGSTFSNSHIGWVAGGGVEWAFAPTWSLKAEYQYADLGTKTYAFPVGGFDPIVHLTSSTIRIGLNKHF